MKKRLLSIFLVLSMLCSFLPTSAYAEGEAVPLTITDAITTNGHLTVTGGTGPYTWQKKTGTGNYEDITYTVYETVGSNIAKDGSWLSVVLTGGGITESSYVTYKVTDTAGTSVEFAQTKYSTKLLNGSFETPTFSSSYSQPGVNTTGLYWKTTAAENKIELARANGNRYFGVSSTPDGTQFAELNCQEEGSLYQDVMTVPGETLSWSFAHRARLQSWGGDPGRSPVYFEGEDTMALVIMDATKFGTTINTQEDILKVVADPTTYNAYVLTNSAGGSWETVSGNYVVPEDQYMTRFFFVSISAASGNVTIGNLIDNVHFTSEKTPVANTATLSIKKVATSTDTTLTTFPNPTIKIYEYVAPTTVGETGTKGNLLWTVTLTANSTTATEIINVPAGTYYIEESGAELTGYSLATTYSVTNPFTITDTDLNTSKAITVTNTYAKTTTDVSVTKVWEDNDNQDGLRTDSVTVELYADNVTTGKTLTLNSTNNWSGKFENLDLKTSTGTTITYTVKETAITGYETTITGSQYTGFTVTNTHTPEKTSIDVTKSWNDNSDQDGIRKDSVTVILVADGVETETTLVLNENNNWTGSFTDLDKYKEGKEIVYTVKEVAVDGYTSVVKENENGGFTITNTHTPEKTSVSVTKTWNDNDNQDGIRPEEITVYLYVDGAIKETVTIKADTDGNWSYTFTDLDKYNNGKLISYTVGEKAIDGYTTNLSGNVESGFVITNTHTPEKISIPVTKVWEDDNNHDGMRTSEVTVILSANGQEADRLVLNASNNWTNSFTGLDKYKDGKEITYTVSEVTVDNYTATITGDQASGYTITNTHENEKTEVKVSKVWVDNDNQDGIRPEEITVYLYADGAVKETVTIKPDANGNWSYTFTDLDKYDNGKEITYTVGEKAVNGYTTDLGGSVETGFVITNTHTPKKTNLPVNKVWKDNGNQDGFRLENITVVLLADGEETTTTLTLNANNNWADTFVNLDKYKDGKEIVYSVKEVTVNEHYTSVVEKNANGGYTVTNTHETEQTEIVVSKAWSDNNDQDGVRPSSVTVVLIADGTDTDKTLVLNENNNWSGSFTNLDKYKDGKEIVYTVKELTVTGYTSEITKTESGDYSITNTHEVEKTEVSVNKVWDDANNQDGLRTGSVTVVLLADGVETSNTLVLNADNNWAGSFTDLDKYKDHGKEIKYTVKELPITSYTTTITGDQINGYTITNTHTPEKISLPVTKTWNDNDDQDGVRPTSVTVVLVADGTDTDKTLVLSEQNNWTGSFAELDKYKEGKEIVYTVKELTVTGYTSEITSLTDGGYSITNTHTPETTSISGTKHWDDNGNQDGARPTEITVNLLADGVIYKTITVTEATDWTYTFEDLPVYKDHGTEIVYTISEEAVDYYTTTYDKFDIINTHTPNKINVKVTKVWDDKDDKDQIRPKEVVVYLVINGDETDIQVTLSRDVGWTSYFVGLDEYDNGEKIEYTVVEKEVDGYTTTYTGDMTEGFVITNSHTPIPVPDTGDHSHIFLWIAVLTVSTAALATAVVLKKRKINE